MGTRLGFRALPWFRVGDPGASPERGWGTVPRGARPISAVLDPPIPLEPIPTSAGGGRSRRGQRSGSPIGRGGARRRSGEGVKDAVPQDPLAGGVEPAMAEEALAQLTRSTGTNSAVDESEVVEDRDASRLDHDLPLRVGYR